MSLIYSPYVPIYDKPFHLGRGGSWFVATTARGLVPIRTLNAPGPSMDGLRMVWRIT